MNVYISLLLLNGEEELELWREFLLAVKPIRKIDSADPAVGMDGDSEGFDVVGSVGPAREVGKVELDLVPALVQPHGHCTDKWLHPGGGLIVGGSESPAHVLIV